MSVRAVVDERGGFATTRELRSRGATKRMLTAAVRFGHVRRVRKGWYSTRPVHDAEFRAVRVGGRLTGISAFRAWGAWVLETPKLVHVAVPLNASRLRPEPGVRVHYEPLSPGGDHSTVSLHDALVRVMLDEPADVAVPCIDWLFRTGRADLIDVERCVLELPAQRRVIMSLVDRGSQSVLESVARVRLLQVGFAVTSQQRTGLAGATDLVIQESVALELDGREFHAPYFERDRRRDLVTTIEGRHVIRVSESMLREEWPHVEAAIRSALAARRVPKSGTSAVLARASQRGNRFRAKRS